MTTKPQADVHPELISDQTKRTLRDFVRDVVSHLSDALKESAAEFEEETRWERGNDGHFRERKKRIRRLWSMLSDEWLRSLPNYQICVECLKSDVVIGPHLDCWIGTHLSSFRLEENYILRSLIDAVLDDEGRLAFTDARFQSKWQEWVGFFGADRIACKMVSPLPYLIVPVFPLRLNDELVLDRLTDDEMTRCCRVGVILPHPLRFIPGEAAVGIRRSMFLPKLIGRGNEPHEPPAVEDEGGFGHRPLFRDDLVIDDVLSALRLFKHGRIRSTGNVSWTDFPAPGGSFRGLGWWPYVRKFELSEGEVPHFLELWRLLEENAPWFGFCIHRFNFAFDRGLLADRIVDLVVAAEALFLGGLGVKDRGELGFRFALRAAKFIEHPSYGEHDIYRLMRKAYDTRSAIVHGGSPKHTQLPDNQSANLPTFIDAIEELVRLGLRKALSMKKDGKKLRQAEYWDTLIFCKPTVQ